MSSFGASTVGCERLLKFGKFVCSVDSVEHNNTCYKLNIIKSFIFISWQLYWAAIYLCIEQILSWHELWLSSEPIGKLLTQTLIESCAFLIQSLWVGQQDYRKGLSSQHIYQIPPINCSEKSSLHSITSKKPKFVDGVVRIMLHMRE